MNLELGLGQQTHRCSVTSVLCGHQAQERTAVTEFTLRYLHPVPSQTAGGHTAYTGGKQHLPCGSGTETVVSAFQGPQAEKITVPEHGGGHELPGPLMYLSRSPNRHSTVSSAS